MRFDYEPEAGGFRVVIDGEERVLPELSGDSLKRWHARYVRAHQKLIGAAESAETTSDWLDANLVAAEDMLDALLAYDRSGILWSREWIEEHVTEEQLQVILQRIQRAHA